MPTADLPVGLALLSLPADVPAAGSAAAPTEHGSRTNATAEAGFPALLTEHIKSAKKTSQYNDIEDNISAGQTLFSGLSAAHPGASVAHAIGFAAVRIADASPDEVVETDPDGAELAPAIAVMPGGSTLPALRQGGAGADVSSGDDWLEVAEVARGVAGGIGPVLPGGAGAVPTPHDVAESLLPTAIGVPATAHTMAIVDPPQLAARSAPVPPQLIPTPGAAIPASAGDPGPDLPPSALPGIADRLPELPALPARAARALPGAAYRREDQALPAPRPVAGSTVPELPSSNVGERLPGPAVSGQAQAASESAARALPLQTVRDASTNVPRSDGNTYLADERGTGSGVASSGIVGDREVPGIRASAPQPIAGSAETGAATARHVAGGPAGGQAMSQASAPAATTAPAPVAALQSVPSQHLSATGVGPKRAQVRADGPLPQVSQPPPVTVLSPAQASPVHVPLAADGAPAAVAGFAEPEERQHDGGMEMLARAAPVAHVGAHGGATPPVPKAEGGLPQAGIPLQPASPGFGDNLGQRILWLSGSNIRSAEIRLDPPELGPLQITVHAHREGTSVHFSTHSTQVREAIEATLPRLREALEGSGMGNVDVNVAQQQGDARPERREAGGLQPGISSRTLNELEPLEASPRRRQGLIDDYA